MLIILSVLLYSVMILLEYKYDLIRTKNIFVNLYIIILDVAMLLLLINMIGNKLWNTMLQI